MMRNTKPAPTFGAKMVRKLPSEVEALLLLAMLAPVAFWQVLHRLAVTSAVDFSDSRFAQFQAEAADSALVGEPWFPHVKAVVQEAARQRRQVS